MEVSLDLCFKVTSKNTSYVKTTARTEQYLTGSSWGANTEILYATVLYLVYFIVKYCAWMYCIYVWEVDVQLSAAPSMQLI